MPPSRLFCGDTLVTSEYKSHYKITDVDLHGQEVEKSTVGKSNGMKFYVTEEARQKTKSCSPMRFV